MQYAHARVCAVLRQAGIARADAPRDRWPTPISSPLTSPYEDALLRRLADFPGELAAAARDLAPHQITFYLKDLAQEFHSYYNAERFLVDDERVKRARLALVGRDRAGAAQRPRGARHRRAGADVKRRQRAHTTALMSRTSRIARRAARNARRSRRGGAARGGTLLGIFIGLIIGLGWRPASRSG